ncbi:hypothetical protein AB0B10_10490 [Micromonospora arborensis]|uniref:hypothetical protein n=1 Tax=Micromonospora arborensis TaxID=2116518 RepID=UPI00340ADA38
MTRPPQTPWLQAAVLVAVLAVAAACTGRSPDSSPKKDDPLQTRAIAEVTALAQARAEAVATTVGIPLDNWRTNTSPCQGKQGETAGA